MRIELNLSSFDALVVPDLQEKLRMIGYYCYKYEIVITKIIIAETTPFNISVQIITAISASVGGPSQRLLLQMTCHPEDPAAA
ncbi:hypothetical protein NKH36_33320 [Mesorhizobium sp. M1312]|uniref:hypothetical protein n=1 Tax=unclassified Mesorhizobium TaxID=325217 RepID=UPI00333BCCC8